MPALLPRPGDEQDQQDDCETPEEFRVGLETLYGGQSRRILRIQESLAPLKGVDRILGLERVEDLLLDPAGTVYGEIAFILENQPDQGSDRPGKQLASLGEQFDLGVQRVSTRPVVEIVQPCAEQKNEVTEKITCKQKSRPGLSIGKTGIVLSDDQRPDVFHEQPGEQRSR